jgi:hypothetical protein
MVYRSLACDQYYKQEVLVAASGESIQPGSTRGGPARLDPELAGLAAFAISDLPRESGLNIYLGVWE